MFPAVNAFLFPLVSLGAGAELSAEDKGGAVKVVPCT